ncbi:hypothetical protein SE19_09080 [Acidiplasma aeolicum]|uniref:Uncharacterized protein n=1 Tax=Acidiplasma aeolicum TaxID=507754 RepID=A0A0P9GQM4_9ARCH|nr:hypothetical protein [Acidiplasma aeolicum]KPV43139.1 hypothetical protein SE19_09080 [Acidiplasma aeolicum]
MNAEYIIKIFINSLYSLINYSVTASWDILVKYGLSPYYSYTQFFNQNKGFMGFYNILISNIYIYVFSTAVIISALILFIKSSFDLNPDFRRYMVKAFSAFLLFWNSYYVAIYILKISYAFYIYIYRLNANWYNILNVSININNKLLSFLFTGSYLFSILLLFTIFIVRQALIIFFIIFMPMVSLLIIVPGTEKYVFKFIRMFFELVFFPFFSISMLYTLSFFSDDPFMQIGIIYVSALAPVYLMTEMFQLFRTGIYTLGEAAYINTIDTGSINPGYILNSGMPVDKILDDQFGDETRLKFN